MRKYLIGLLLSIGLILVFNACNKPNIEPEGNAKLYLSDIKFSGFGTVAAIKGRVKTKVYSSTDTSSSLVVSNLSNDFSIREPNGQNQIIGYDLTDNVKKLEISIIFQMEGGAAEQLSIANLKFLKAGNTLYNKDNEVVKASAGTTSFFELETFTIEF